MEVLFVILAALASGLVVFFVVKFNKQPGEDDATPVSEDEGNASKKSGKKSKRASSGHKQISSGEDTLKKPVQPVENMKPSKKADTPLAEKVVLAQDNVDSAPKKDNSMPLNSNAENSNELRKRKGSQGSSKKVTLIAETNQENRENNEPDINISELVDRARSAEKKLATSERQCLELTNRVSSLERKLTESEQRLQKAKEDEQVKTNQASKLAGDYSNQVSKLEAQLNDLRKKFDEAARDKLLLQQEVAANSRSKIALEKEIQELKKAAPKSPAKVGPVHSETFDSLVCEIIKSLPEFKPEAHNFSDCLRNFVSSARLRIESEHEKSSAIMKQKISELEKELSKSRHQVDEVNQMVKHKMAEWEGKFAKQDSENNVLRIQLAEASRLNGDLQANLLRLESDLKSKVAEIENMLQQRSDLERRTRELEASNSSNDRELMIKIDHLNGELAELRPLREYCERIVGEKAVLETDLKEKRELADRLAHELNDAKREVDVLRGSVSSQQSEMARTIEQLQHDVAEKQREIDSLHQKASSYDSTVSQLTAELEGFRRVSGDSNEKLDRVMRELADKSREYDRINNERLDLNNQYEKLSAELTERSHEVTTLRGQAGHFEARVAELMRELDMLRNNQGSTSDAVDQLVKEKSDLQAKFDKVKAMMTEKLRENEELRRMSQGVSADFEAVIASKQNEIEQLRKVATENSEMATELRELRQKVQNTLDLQSKFDDATRELNEKREFEAKFHAMTAETAEKLREIEELRRQLQQHIDERSALERSVNDLREELNKERSNAGSLSASNQDLANRVQNLEAEAGKVHDLRRSVDDLSSELIGEKSRTQQTVEARDLLERTASLLETQLKDVEQNLNETKAMYSQEVTQLRQRLESLTNELNEERQTVAKLRSENTHPDSAENCASSKILKLDNGITHPLTENGNAENGDEISFLRDELTKAKLANSHAEEALLALQEELNVAMAKVGKMETDYSEMQQLIRTGEEALKAEQQRNEELQKKLNKKKTRDSLMSSLLCTSDSSAN